MIRSLKKFGSAIEELHPAYFALVMATGIVAIAAHFEGLSTIARTLSWFNAAGFVVLGAMYLLRLVFYSHSFAHDIADFERGPGFFTIVAAAGVFGSQAIIIFGSTQLAFVLWASSVALWAVLIYTIFAAFTVKETKPSPQRRA